ncbi:uncharacterized protein LOC113516427 [Galleria mellonella]|uniref:Uncharacterized protein LOC113516427 n=1 Tax=Galleria mellonella TaxID=7137 RepID=A0ABM3MF67_GALME|nr:uncharacterized protein LOC113516427 [Galleria mellonella]
MAYVTPCTRSSLDMFRSTFLRLRPESSLAMHSRKPFHFFYRSLTSKIINETTCIIWDILQPQEIPELSEALWLEIAKRYYKKTNYPNCIGSIDGDEAFGLQKHILRPFPNKSLNKEERIYNYRHNRARRCVKYAFGILTSKWRVLHTPIATNVNTIIAIVKVVCILHNFVIAREQVQYAHISRRTSTTLTSTRNQIITVSNSGKTAKENFKNYFLNEGKLPWQNSICKF